MTCALDCVAVFLGSRCVGFLAVSFSRSELLTLVSSLLFSWALGFSFYFGVFFVSVYSFFGQKSCIKLADLFTRTTLGLSSWLIGNLIATHISFAMLVVAQVILQRQIGNWVVLRWRNKLLRTSRPLGYNTVGGKSNDGPII